jgi:hypothetical protein
MSAEPTPIARVSLFARLPLSALAALALAGCAASVENVPASVPVSAVAYVAAPRTVDPPLAMPEAPAPQADLRQASAAAGAPVVSRRRDVCGR